MGLSLGGVVGAIGGALGGGGAAVAGPGAAPVDPYKVKAGAFTDPNAEKNRLLLEEQRKKLAAGGASTGNVAGLIKSLQERQAGTVPSVAATQLAQTTDANRRAAFGMAASGAPGGNPALALRSALNAGTQANQQAAGQAATLRATEQTQAEQGLIAAVQTQAGEENARNQLTAQYVAQGMSADQAAFQAQQDLEKLKSANYNAAHGLTTQGQIAGQQAQVAGANTAGGVIGGIVGGIGGAIGLSDERVKMKVRPGGEATRDMLDHYAQGGPVLPDVGGPVPPTTDPTGMVQGILARTGYGDPDFLAAGARSAANVAGMSKLLSKMRTGASPSGPMASPRAGGGLNMTGKAFEYGGGPPAAAGIGDLLAGGGPVRGPGGPKDDKVPILASNGEHVLAADDVQAMGGHEGVQGLLEAVKAKQFAYKGEGPGAEHIGVMAQDMEKSPLGKTMVLDTPAGKMVDGGMIMPALLAAAADMNRRIDALEQRKRGRNAGGGGGGR